MTEEGGVGCPDVERQDFMIRAVCKSGIMENGGLGVHRVREQCEKGEW